MTLKYPMLLAAMFTVLSIGCKKKEGPTGPQGPAGPSGPAYYGVIAGHVSIYDQYGIRTYEDLDGIKVDLNGSRSTLTDSVGYYRFDSVPTGNYVIATSKTGYAATKSAHTAFVKDTLYKNLKMSTLPNFKIASFRASYNTGSQFDSLVVNVDVVDSKPRNWIVFVSNKPTVGPTDYLLAYVRPIATGALTSVYRLPAGDLNNAGIFYGEVVYYAAYSYVVNDVSLYDDPFSGRIIYTSLGNGIADTTTAP